MITQQALSRLLIDVVSDASHLVRVGRPIRVADRMGSGLIQVVEVGLVAVSMEQGGTVVLRLPPLGPDSNLRFSQPGQER